jgi:hypothetical protein
MTRPLLPDNLVKKLQDANDSIRRLENQANQQILVGALLSRPPADTVRPATRFRSTDDGAFYVAIAGQWVQETAVGPGGGREEFVQSTPSAVWTFTYSGSTPPNVTSIDTTGRVIYGDVTYNVSAKTFTITHGSPVSGRVYAA